MGNGSCQDYLMEKDFLVCHEMGHALGLHHVWNNWDNPSTTNQYLLAEHVTREPLNPDGSVNTNYNADIAGDFVADTPVTRSELYAFHYNENNCKLKNLDSPTFPMRDIQGTLFDFENIKYDNFMSYIYKVNNPNCGSNYQLPGCSDRIFTPGQGVAMRKFIQNVPYVYTNFGDTGYTTTNFNFTLTYLESLYEPFFVGGGGSNSGYPSVALKKTYSTNQTFTGANVWNCGPFTMRFQPGFNYEFFNLPGTLLQNEDMQPNIASSTYIGVKIPYISNTIINSVAPSCFGTYEPFTSGDIKSTLNMGSTYYTQEELDKIKASDPELYEKLQSQMYHIITKQTDSGYSDQKIIHKN